MRTGLEGLGLAPGEKVGIMLGNQVEFPLTWLAVIEPGLGVDATRTDPDFLCKAVELAIKCGATTVNIPDTVGYATPKDYGTYPNFFEQLSIFSGALALYAVTSAQASRSLAHVARIGYGLATISFTYTQIFYFAPTVAVVPHWIPPNQKFWAILTTVAFGLAAVAILINIRARLALRLTALMTALFGALVWIPIVVAHPRGHSNWSEFCLISAAAWLVADSL